MGEARIFVRGDEHLVKNSFKKQFQRLYKSFKNFIQIIKKKILRKCLKFPEN